MSPMRLATFLAAFGFTRRFLEGRNGIRTQKDRFEESAIGDIQESGDFAAGGVRRIELFELFEGSCRDDPRRHRLFLTRREKCRIDRGIHGLGLLQRLSYNH